MDHKTFEVKDSGARATLGGGVRDTEEGKLDYTLILDGVMYERWAAHLTKGAKKYAARNWLKFFETKQSAREAYDRAGRSLMRHQKDYMDGKLDEDHAAAMVFNLNVRETALKCYPDLFAPDTAPAPFKRYKDSDGKWFVETGEYRVPNKGEPYLMALEVAPKGEVAYNGVVMSFHGGKRRILRPL
jgi:hypothetical protein